MNVKFSETRHNSNIVSFQQYNKDASFPLKITNLLTMQNIRSLLYINHDFKEI